MSDLEALTDLLGIIEHMVSDIDDFEVSLETHRKMKRMVQAWSDQVIELIDDYEEGVYEENEE